jgi:hypothetical protein
MKDKYVLIDPQGRFFQGLTEYIPQIVHAFCGEYDYAKRYDSFADADAARATILPRLYTFDGDENVPTDYLRIAKVEFKVLG